MPITPRFNLSQTTAQLIITIHIPHIRVSASTLEIIVDQSEFHFYSSPYLLHLNFDRCCPNENGGDCNATTGSKSNNRILLDDESLGKEAKAVYDPSNENGTLVVTIWKEVECMWDDIDLLGKLMMTNATRTGNNLLSSLGNNNLDGNKSDHNNKIQVLSSSTEGTGENSIDNDFNSNNKVEEEYAGDDNNISRNMKSLDELQSCFKPHYGFLQMHHSVFTAYAREGLSHDMLEIPNPDELNSTNDIIHDDDSNANVDIHYCEQNIRREMRLEMENEKFCPNRYIGDLYISDTYDDDDADMTFIEAKRMVPHWKDNKKLASLSQSTSSSSSKSSSLSIDKITNQLHSMNMKDDSTSRKSRNLDFFTEKESMRLASIHAQVPPLSHISEEQTQSTFLSLLDILYAYVYDHRMSIGESTCESSWTIVMLSPTLSWLESYNSAYDSVEKVIGYSIRRALIYPYIRNYDFACNVILGDVLKILSGGKRVVLRCLLEVHAIFDSSEFHYLFNKLYINHYICWLQEIDEQSLELFLRKVKQCVSVEEVGEEARDYIVEKHSLGLDLEFFEQQALNNIENCEGENSPSSSETNTDDDSDGENSSDEGTTSSDDSSHNSGGMNETQSCKSIVDEGMMNNQPARENSLLDDEIGLVQGNEAKIGHLFQMKTNVQPSPSSKERSQKGKSLITEILD